MTATSFSAAPTNNTDANFRLWGSGMKTALAAVGLVQTADTGQIDWTTVVAPVATQTVKGYEIWRFNDSLQSTVPIYIKIEYGSGTGAAIPQIKYSVGSGTDGAGNLTNVHPASAGSFTCGGASSSTTLFPWLVAFSNGILTISPGITDSIFYTHVFTVSRLLDQSTGAPTDEGFVAACYAPSGSSSGFAMCFRAKYGTWFALPQGIGQQWPFNTGVSAIFGGKPYIGATRWHTQIWDRQADENLAFVLVSSIDWKPGGVFTAYRWDGVKHTYVVTPESTSITNTLIAILWE